MRNVKTQWMRVTKKNPCPVCGKPDWCMIAEDGKTAICARVQSEKAAGNKGAGWVHELIGSVIRPAAPAATGAVPAPRNTPAVIDRTYRALFTLLTLSDLHRQNLLSRGLIDGDIAFLGYRSLPADRADIVRRLGAAVMAGVPGFYREYSAWKLNGPPGLALPVKGIRGNILGIQIRRYGAVKPKYVWLSSSKKQSGCSPGNPVHVARSSNDTNDIWVTEGIIKADIAALRLKRIVLAVAGVGSWSGTIPVIKYLHPERVIIAFDMDKTTNPAVKLHTGNYIDYLLKSGIRTFEADWDSKFKGIDDLIKGVQPCPI